MKVPPAPRTLQLGKKRGPEIDAHDTVFRYNGPIKVGPGRKCSKYKTMEFNSRIEGLNYVEGHFEHFLPSPASRWAVVQHVEPGFKALETIICS